MKPLFFSNLLIKISFFALLFCSQNDAIAQSTDRYTEDEIAFQTAFLTAKHKALLGEKDEAIEDFKALYKKHRTESTISFELAKLYESKGDLLNAILNAEKAAKLDPDNTWYVTFLAERYEQNQEHGLAASTYAKLLDNKDKNIRYIYEKIAYNQLSDNKPEASLKTLNDLELITGVEENLSRKKYDVYLAMGQEDNALNELKKLSEAFPDDTRYLKNLAITYQKLGKLDQAKSSLQQLLNIEDDAEAQLMLSKLENPKGAGTLTTLATYVENREHNIKEKITELVPYVEQLSSSTTDQAELFSILNSLRSNHPKEAAAYAITGDAYYNLGAFDDAITNYEKTIELDDTRYSVWAQMMESYFHKQDFNRLKKVSENAMDFFPNQALSYIFYAKANTALKEYAIAEDYLEEASLISGGAENIMNHVSLAKIDNQAQKGSTNEAKAMLENLIKGKAKINVAHLEYLGDIYYRLGMTKEAIKSWEMADKGPYANPILKEKILKKSI